MVTTVRFDDEGEQWLVAPTLRPGNAKGSAGAVAILKRLVPRLRAAFPKARIRVRLDGAFATPEVLEWLERERLGYAVNMAKNQVLKGLAEPLMCKIRRLSEKTGKSEKAYAEFSYKAGSWKMPRRVVLKAEVVRLEGREPRDNPRFVITNLKWSPESCYVWYAVRGDAENRLKELKHGLRFDLTSCTAFNGNQLRNLLTAAAYALYQQVRRAASGTECSNAQVSTLRDRLIKIAVCVIESVRRIVLKAPSSFPWLATWRRAALALASPG